MNICKHIVTPFILALLLLPGCESIYYGTWEKLGVHKRDMLVDRVEEARDDQQAAAEQFADALEQFRSVVNFDAGELGTLYDRLNRELQQSEAKAEAVDDQIEEVRDVADDLFTEWERELADYQSAELRRASEAQLERTRSRYNQMIRAMTRAADSMEPVLVVFRDQVLFLKHNLNARAIDALQETTIALEDDVAALIERMNDSIAEADAFIEAMRSD
jgi:ElaB/YqjD/DUF883 family membrane-anchored ribosome-binding protein